MPIDYVLITPARNEAALIEATIQSVVSQTVKPKRWVIVSDGSTDGTDEIIARHGGPSFDDAGHAALRSAAAASLPDLTAEVVVAVEKVVSAAHDVRSALAAPAPPALAPSIEDMRAQLFALIRPGFVTATGVSRLPDLPRYLRAIEKRLDGLPDKAGRDAQLMEQVQQIEREYRELRGQVPMSGDLLQIRWMIEELRVSLFAQNLGTPYPVSATRIYRAIDALRA